MRKQIRRFGIGQTSKVVAVMYALMALVLVPVFLFSGAVSQKQTGFSTGFALALPLIYGACGFIFTAIGCAIYNFVAGMVGGVEMEFDGDEAKRVTR